MVVCSLLIAGQASAVVLFTDDFAANNENWVDRDAGEMDVGHNAGFGNAAGSMEGSFDQDVFVPETDAFRLTTIPNGSDLTQAGTYIPTSFSFQFYADDIVPSDLILRFGNGSFTFFRGFTVPGIDSWHTFNASLASVSGWFGGSQANFESVLENTTFIEIQVTRNGSDAQTFYFDNFTLNGDEDDGGPGPGDPSAVPEPNSLSLFAFIALVGMAIRRFRGFSREADRTNAGALGTV